MKHIEFGLYSLGDYIKNPYTDEKISEAQRIEEIIQAAKLADALGIDVFAVGESHQEHFISQAHALILAAIARETKQITISSSATIISTSDPVRIYENFATLDLLSKGRAEIVGGRASRVGLFKLLGYDLRNYEALFEEKFELLLKLNTESPVNWEGVFRAPLDHAILYPKPLQERLPIWRAVGGPPHSAVLAGQQGVPMTLATLGGPATLFNRSIEVYRENYRLHAHPEANMKVAVTNLFHVGNTDKEAHQKFFKYVDTTLKHANGHGFNRPAYANALDVRDVMLVGSVQTIVDKMVYQYQLYQHDRFLFQLDLGGITFPEIEHQIHVIAQEIIPAFKARIEALEGATL